MKVDYSTVPRRLSITENFPQLETELMQAVAALEELGQGMRFYADPEYLKKIVRFSKSRSTSESEFYEEQEKNQTDETIRIQLSDNDYDEQTISQAPLVHFRIHLPHDAR